MNKLNRNHIPLYFQLQQILRKKILSGKIALDEALPTESELCKKYGVSRTTVRQAFTALLNEKLILRIPGKGTFVTQQDSQENVVHFFNTTESLISKAYFASFDKTFHYRGVASPSARLIEIFGLEQDQKIFCIRGSRYKNGKPLCYFITNFSSEHAHYFKGKRLNTEVLLNVLEKELGIAIKKARHTIRAVKADKQMAKYLEIQEDSPVLELEQIYYMPNDVAVEVGINYFHADRFSYVLELIQKK